MVHNEVDRHDNTFLVSPIKLRSKGRRRKGFRLNYSTQSSYLPLVIMTSFGKPRERKLNQIRDTTAASVVSLIRCFQQKRQVSKTQM